jgi:hypothetical protein
MATNLEKYEKDLDALIAGGERVLLSLELECVPEVSKVAVKKKLGGDVVDKLSEFDKSYQAWYSEAKVLIKLLLPDRLADFVRHYEKPKPRKDITFENYRIEDALQGLVVTRVRGVDRETLANMSAAIPHMRQQLQIVKAVKARFQSSLFDIRQLVMADLFDSELEAAAELAKKKFLRAAGAIAGVVLEKHLHQVCDNHSIVVSKKDAGISHLNDLLKGDGVIDVPQWRAIQYLGDLRNVCDHPKQEPTHQQITELIEGVTKVTKTLF